MTEKELLYIEDALGHAEYFQTQCQETASRLSDPKLQDYVRQMGQNHLEIYQKLLGLL